MPNPSKELLLSSINNSMKLTKSFFMRIYGYEIGSPGFSEIALSKLEESGCSKAREYYSTLVNEYEEKQKDTMKEVAAWYVKHLHNRRRCEEVNKWESSSTHQSNYSRQQKENLQAKLDRLKKLI